MLCISLKSLDRNIIYGYIENSSYLAETCRAANWCLQWRCCLDNYHPEAWPGETEIRSFINDVFTALSCFFFLLVYWSKIIEVGKPCKNGAEVMREAGVSVRNMKLVLLNVYWHPNNGLSAVGRCWSLGVLSATSWLLFPEPTAPQSPVLTAWEAALDSTRGRKPSDRKLPHKTNLFLTDPKLSWQNAGIAVALSCKQTKMKDFLSK